ncbi:MAG: DNA polymerase III subunit delta [Pseudomonadota bacterium]
MKIYPEKLSDQLSRDHTLYVVMGDEPLVVQESCDQIRAHLRGQGFERELFHVEGQFKWDEVLHSANSMGLFAEQKLLEVRIPNGKPGDSGAKGLAALIELLTSETRALVVLPRLDRSGQNSKWFKGLEKAGLVVQVFPVDRSRLPGWVRGRFKQAGLSPSKEAVDALVDRIEGNQLAAVQEIERIRLISNSPEVSAEEVVNSVADAARFDVFMLIDAALAQDAQRVVKVSDGLRAEGAEPIVVLAMVAREVRMLLAMTDQKRTGGDIGKLMGTYRVFPKRKPIVERCVAARTYEEILGLMPLLVNADRMAKGMATGDPWTCIREILLSVAGVNVVMKG